MADNPKKKKKEEVEEGLPIWMATFADMMTLLFAFFVLLFSMATIDPVKVSAMEDAMNEYVDLRRSQGRRPFIDAPHFEMM